MAPDPNAFNARLSEALLPQLDGALPREYLAVADTDELKLQVVLRTQKQLRLAKHAPLLALSGRRLGRRRLWPAGARLARMRCVVGVGVRALGTCNTSHSCGRHRQIREPLRHCPLWTVRSKIADMNQAVRTLEPLVGGRYRIHRPLGEGGMGVVYEVHDEASGQRLALKRVHSHITNRELFEREYRTLASLHHSGIVQVLDYGVEEAGAFYTMELLEGTDLSKAAPMPWREVCGCLRECASILGVLHAHRLMHRDLNPRNIWRQPDGKLKLLDFGALAPFGKARDVVGVPALVAPEALRSGVLDQRTDLFALGALGYWLLTSTHAYQATNFAELKRAWEKVPTSPSSVARFLGRADVDIPDQLDKLLLSLLRLDPAERPSSTFNVIDELNAIAGLAPEVEEVAATGYLESTAFVGRERERDAFSASVTRALAGGLQVISLEGPEGIGRTRLLAELAIAARLAGATVLSAAAGPADRPYHTLSSLGCALQMALPQPASLVARPRAQVLGSLSPELNQLLGQPKAPPRTADPAEERQRKQEAFAEWLLGVAREHPLVVLVDDLHLADEESQALLATLARSRPQHRLLLVGTLRADSPLAEHAGVRAFQAVARRLVIPPFESGQTLELLRSMFGPVAYLERLALRLHEVSAGVPRHLLLLARHLVRTGAAKYVDGTWILPSEVPQDLPPTLDTSVRASLDAVAPEVRALARLASVPDHGSLSRTMLAALYGKSPARTDEAIATLLEAQVLSESRDGIQPTQAKLAALLWAELNADEQARAHRAVAACLDAQDDPVLGMRKAVHLLRGGAFEAAESLVLAAARQVLLDPTEALRIAAPMFAEACELLDAGGRSDARLPALMVSAVCGYFVDRSYAARYADQATTQLARALRFGLARRLTPIVGGLLSLLVALLVASVSLRVRRSKLRVLEIVSWLVTSALASAGTAATCLDPRAIRRHANSIAPLRALGKNHAASVAHDFCTALALGSEDRQAASLALSHRVLDRLNATAPIRGLHQAARAKFLIGAHFQIGVRLALACDLRALALADTLAQMGPLPALQADQIRALCLSSRGDHVGAAVYERQIEPKAIKLGTAWQAEIWLPLQASRRALLTNDAVGAKHASQALGRLVAEAQTPTLAAHERSAQATYLVLRHKYREAISVLDANEEPLARAGWAYGRGLLARAHNEQAEYAAAERVCSDALSRLERADLDFVTLNLCLQSESAIAQAGQGRFEQAERSLADLLTAYADKGSLVLGWLHRARARVASMKGDADAAQRELALMEQQYLTTRNPHLLRLTAELKAELRRASSGGPAGGDLPATEEDTHLLTRVRLLLEDEAKDRVQRAQDALSMAKQLVGAARGFIWYAGAPIAWTSQTLSPEAIAWAEERLQRAAAEGGRTASTSLTEFTTENERGVFDGMHHSLCLLWCVEGYLEVPIAAMVLASEAGPPDAPPGAVLRVMGESLAAASSADAITVRSRRPDGVSCDSKPDHATPS